jgi:hypothetical protein
VEITGTGDDRVEEAGEACIEIDAAGADGDAEARLKGVAVVP